MKAKLFSTLSIILMLAVAVMPASAATSNGPDTAPRNDSYSHPLGDQQAELKAKAVEAKLNGKAQDKVYEVARGQFVELEREGEDSIWTLLGEFSDLKHNQIPQPDRSVDNSTIWAPDFSEAYFENLLFSEAPGAISMRNFFIEQSSNRYTVNGDVTDWVTVPGTAVSYDDNPDSNVWNFLQDSIDAWYAEQLAAGMTPTQIDSYLSQFDVWDRYDWDGDGDFNEGDGYIDHFQSVHAGMGEEVGGGVLGAQAIWSHRWYANYGDIGVIGPSPDYLLGGLQIGGSSYWIGDYTIEPENGGVGVFAHEFSHDLGLPDLYATQGGENSTGFWTLMSSGSYGNSGAPEDGIGTKPIHMGAWEKFQLGWLNYEVARAGQKSEHKIGPAETNTRQAQGVFVVLPPKPVTVHIADPAAGSYFYFSGSANNLNNKMTKAFTLGAGATLTAKVNYGIEEGYDYANVIVSTDGGATWQTVPTNLSNSTVEANGIEGFSGGWVDLTANLPAGNVMVGFQYRSDGGVNYDGFMVDELQISGYPTDGAETDTGWTFSGFRRTTGTEERLYNNYYLAEFRQYRGYDLSLKTGPYNFGFLNTLPNWVEHFPYQDGLLISYWDTSQADNNTPQHPGKGLIIPIDSHSAALMRPDNTPWRNRVQSYDSTFSLESTDPITVSVNGLSTTYPSQPAVKVFNDLNQYWNPATPTAGVMNPNTGTIIEIRSYSALGNFMQVQVRPAR